MDDFNKGLTFIVIGVFLLFISLIAGSILLNKYDCYDKAEKLEVKADWSINAGGYEHCIYTLENGKKIEAEDYKYFIIENTQEMGDLK